MNKYLNIRNCTENTFLLLFRISQPPNVCCFLLCLRCKYSGHPTKYWGSQICLLSATGLTRHLATLLRVLAQKNSARIFVSMLYGGRQWDPRGLGGWLAGWAKCLAGWHSFDWSFLWRKRCLFDELLLTCCGFAFSCTKYIFTVAYNSLIKQYLTSTPHHHHHHHRRHQHQ